MEVNTEKNIKTMRVEKSVMEELHKDKGQRSGKVCKVKIKYISRVKNKYPK